MGLLGLRGANNMRKQSICIQQSKKRNMAEQAFALARNKGNWIEVSAVICCVALGDKRVFADTVCG